MNRYSHIREFHFLHVIFPEAMSSQFVLIIVLIRFFIFGNSYLLFPLMIFVNTNGEFVVLLSSTMMGLQAHGVM